MLSARVVARTAGLRVASRLTLAKSVPCMAMMRLSRVCQGASGRNFSSTVIRKEKEVEMLHTADAELLESLKSEIEMEEESTNREISELSRGFLNDNGFSLKVTAGSDEVELVKKEGNETIHVTFSITDTQQMPPIEEEEFEEEGATEKDGSRDMRDGEFFGDESFGSTRVNIVIEKPDGAMVVDAVVQGSDMVLESVVPYEDPKLALADNAQADFERASKYRGTPVPMLDESVQSALEEYLNVRGLNEDFTLFLDDFVTHQENLEYLEWLKDIQKFLLK